jgi:AraC-like DNA-binding protein
MKVIKRFFPGKKSSVLGVYGLAMQEVMRGVVHRPAGGQHYLFMYFYDDVLVDDGRTDRWAGPHSLVVLGPGCAHRYGHPSKSWRHSWIAVNGSFIVQQLKQNRVPLNQVLYGADASFMEQTQVALSREMQEQAEPDEVILQNLIQNWIRDLRRRMDGPRTHVRVPRPYLVLRRYIEENYDRKTTLAGLAARMHVSRCHLSREFRRFFGVSPIQHLLRVRMHHAAHLVHDHNLRISEIARSIGYDDLFQFSKLFKQHFGVSPRNMRAKQSKSTPSVAS